MLKALGTDPQSATSIRGASGYSHDFLAVGVDRQHRRLLVISREPDSRIAAMAQADVQAADTSIHVITARPILFDFSSMIRAAQLATGKKVVTGDELVQTNPTFAANGPQFMRLMRSDKADDMRWLLTTLLQEMVDQIGIMADNLRANKKNRKKSTALPAAVPAELFAHDALAGDLAVGICPLPLYELSATELDLILSAEDTKAIREMLRTHELLQYFFPPPDHVALGILDRCPTTTSTVPEILSEVPRLGHPFGTPELIAADVPFTEVLNALSSKGLIIEGEVSTELTPAGRIIRSSVRFKPRESILTKLINRLSVSLNLRDLFGGPPGGA